MRIGNWIIITGFNLQWDKCNVYLKRVAVSESGLWQTSIYINAQTKQMHTDNDVTYNVIHVPQQEAWNARKK